MGTLRRSWILLAAPNAVLLVLLLVTPLTYVATLSFRAYSTRNFAGGEFSLANYAVLLDRHYLGIAMATLRMAIITTLITLLLAYPVAYWLARASGRTKALGMFLILAPLMISVVLRTYGWIVILAPTGVLNGLLQAIGFTRLRLMNTDTATTIGLVHIFLPYMVLPLMAAIERIPRALEEAAEILGAPAGYRFLRVILPLSLPGVISGCVLTFALALSSYVTPTLLGSPSTRMITQEIYDKVYVSFNLPEAAALTTVMLLTVGTLVILGMRALRDRRGKGTAAP